MEEWGPYVLTYLRLAGIMIAWIFIAGLLVAGFERVFFSIFTRRPPADSLVTPPMVETNDKAVT